MNEATEVEVELEIVELGDVKEETKGWPTGIKTEQNSDFQYQKPL